MKPLRPGVVIDTNVWISGLLAKTGHPAQFTRQVVRAAQPVFSGDTFAELKDRLWRPKFDRYVTLEQRKALLGDLESIALWVDVPPSIAAKTYSRDPADDKFIHAALAAETAWLVTGDKDLLILSENMLPHGVRIISPADAMCLPEFSPPL
ncbi:MAG: putative toxin-antitoxin system toxin component, PIN family [Candidatus Competibacteraceae bacterium]